MHASTGCRKLWTVASSGDPDARYTVAEVARLVKLSTQRVRDLARAGVIPAQVITENRDHAEYILLVRDIDALISSGGIQRGAIAKTRSAEDKAHSGQSLRSQVDELRKELERERRGRDLAEARIDELRRALGRQRQAIIDLTVEGFDPADEDVPRG